MAYLSPTEILTHLKSELIDLIEEDYAGPLQSAIDAAISEMRGYLSFYDVTAILAATGTNREAILLLYTKDIAVWHFIQLANPNIDLALRQIRYDRAIDWLKGVQKGAIVPNLPMPVNTDPLAQDGKIKWGSNTKRITSF
jgi:phage gp36-like protein